MACWQGNTTCSQKPTLHHQKPLPQGLRWRLPLSRGGHALALCIFFHFRYVPTNYGSYSCTSRTYMCRINVCTNGQASPEAQLHQKVSGTFSKKLLGSVLRPQSSQEATRRVPCNQLYGWHAKFDARNRCLRPCCAAGYQWPKIQNSP